MQYHDRLNINKKSYGHLYYLSKISLLPLTVAKSHVAHIKERSFRKSKYTTNQMEITILNYVEQLLISTNVGLHDTLKHTIKYNGEKLFIKEII